MFDLSSESEDEKKQRELNEQWSCGDYDNGENGCPNCGRFRLCKCPNGMRRCEKCNWSPELNAYSPAENW